MRTRRTCLHPDCIRRHDGGPLLLRLPSGEPVPDTAHIIEVDDVPPGEMRYDDAADTLRWGRQPNGRE